MDLNSSTSSIWGWIGGGGLATVVMAALQLRKRLSRDGVERHRDQAEKSIIDRLSEELDKADKRVEAADKRAEDAYDARNNMLRELAPIHSTMAAMEERLKQQAELIAKQNQDLARLRREKRDAI
ncbi:hypothetical protein B0G84_5757 [Paraburkholderia sp. BL8N3]|nr:hypothetical protein [Paraburkholderia sp. BL8N3]TCK36744.1 hypothetical protein B0G84_5757 [Paraburkholderia sp. BL8N3]